MIRNRKKSVSFLAISIIGAILCASSYATPVAVKFREGVIHSFVIVSSMDGQTIGHGELTQVPKGRDLVERRLIFRFKDGSVHDERAAFTQQDVFTLTSYRLTQRGPVFPEQLDAAVDRRTGEYKVISREHNEKEELLTGYLEDIPGDVSNGIVVAMLNNIPKGTNQIVSTLIFTPKPKVVPLHLLFVGNQSLQVGGRAINVKRYAFEPELGTVQTLLGKMFGKPPLYFRYDCWILDDDVPGFVRFDGRLQVKAPIMRIEMASPRLPSNIAAQ